MYTIKTAFYFLVFSVLIDWNQLPWAPTVGVIRWTCTADPRPISQSRLTINIVEYLCKRVSWRWIATPQYRLNSPLLTLFNNRDMLFLFCVRLKFPGDSGRIFFEISTIRFRGKIFGHWLYHDSTIFYQTNVSGLPRSRGHLAIFNIYIFSSPFAVSFFGAGNDGNVRVQREGHRHHRARVRHSSWAPRPARRSGSCWPDGAIAHGREHRCGFAARHLSVLRGGHQRLVLQHGGKLCAGDLILCNPFCDSVLAWFLCYVNRWGFDVFCKIQMVTRSRLI